VLIQTCNRTEFYYGEGHAPAEISLHLFRVVSGLESSFIGESAIQGQVKESYIGAAKKFNLDKGLHQLFQNALHVGKKVRSLSGITRGAVSHSQAAAEIIAQSGLNLKNSIISLIGAHKLNEDIIRFLKNKGAETFFLSNKSFDKAENLANQFGCTAMKLDNLKQMLEFSDILISATAAPHLIVKKELFPKNKKMLILDLAFPRDVEEEIGKFPGVRLFNLEQIEQFVNQNILLRKAEIIKAEEIIGDFLEKQSKNAKNEHYISK
jgi:glutamyl-tRNA reductase